MVPWSTRIAYAMPAFALAAVGIPLYVHVPRFYTDVVGVPVGTIAGVLLAVRVFDALSDVVAGWLSDHTPGPFGRRRPWIAVGSVALAAALWALFDPPVMGEGAEHAAALRFGVVMFLLFTAWTAVVVPYESLGNELSEDFDERTTVLGLRDGLLLVGTLFAASLPTLLSSLVDFVPGAVGERHRFEAMALVYAPMTVLLCALCVLWVRERPAPPGGRQGSLADLRRDLWDVLVRNKPFRVLLISYTVGALGSNLPGTLILYYTTYVLKTQHAELFLLLYFVVGILLLPAWIPVSRKIGKKAAYIVASFLNGGAFVFVFFLGPGQELAYGTLVALSAVGFGGWIAIPSSMQADVIDYDEALSGRRREGRYVGLWSLSRKLAAAASVGVALWILGEVGYVPNVEQSPDVLLTLRVLYCLVPSLLAFAALVLVLGYPIDREAHARIRDAIARRKAGEIVEDPLA